MSNNEINNQKSSLSSSENQNNSSNQSNPSTDRGISREVNSKQEKGLTPNSFHVVQSSRYKSKTIDSSGSISSDQKTTDELN